MSTEGNLVAYLTIIRKEMTRMVRLWKQTILPSAITMSLYFVIFGKFIGSQVSDISGFSYMQFIVPGLVMMAVITTSYEQAISGFFFSKFSKSIEEILVSPTPMWVIISGFTSAGVIRGFAVGGVVLLISLFFTNLSLSSFLITAIFILLTAVLFSLAGLLNGLYAKRIDQVAVVPTFVLMPLTQLGGVFYSVSLLPPFWEAFSKLNPILYMVNGFRYGFLGISDVNIFLSLGVLSFLVFTFFVVVFVLFKRGWGIRT